VVALATGLAQRPGASLPEACGDRATLKAAYRFFNNVAIDPQHLLDSHIDATLARLATVPLVLAVQDTTELDGMAHPATTGLGPLGHPAHRSLEAPRHAARALYLGDRRGSAYGGHVYQLPHDGHPPGIEVDSRPQHTAQLGFAGCGLCSPPSSIRRTGGMRLWDGRIAGAGDCGRYHSILEQWTACGKASIVVAVQHQFSDERQTA
jgi:hypothetical protein